MPAPRICTDRSFGHSHEHANMRFVISDPSPCNVMLAGESLLTLQSLDCEIDSGLATRTRFSAGLLDGGALVIRLNVRLDLIDTLADRLLYFSGRHAFG